MERKNPSSTSTAPELRKRKDPPPGPNSSKKNQSSDSRPPGRVFKRVKFQDARNIRTQLSDVALEDGKLDLQKFLNAREFEIKALETSMRKCKAANATRAFQQVPRAMRRRTASHNVKRIPKRLRDKAKREQVEDNTPTVDARKRRPRTTRARIRAETAKRLNILAAKKKRKQLQKASADDAAAVSGEIKNKLISGVQTRQARPKIRRNTLNDPPKPKTKFRKRQVNKTWLPTHLWHAKRATMTEPGKPLWRFAIPLTPTEKCYRPTHRASGQKGVVVWDMSYMSTIGLYGTEEGVERVLKALGLTQQSIWGNRGRSWRAGTRSWTGVLSKPKGESRRNIGPATIIWNPEVPMEDVDTEQPASPKKSQRQLFIHVHPSCFLELFNELLKLVKMQAPQPHVEDLRFEIGSIRLTGPGSTETLLGVLQPYYDSVGTEECHGRIFKSLVGVTNPASLPKDALLSFSARDPRLLYPPRPINPTNGIAESDLLKIMTEWPVERGLGPSGLFSRDARFRASQLPPQKTINRRKGLDTPEKALEVITAVDPPIPVVLLASRPATDGQAQGTWTLLAPWKCILPIWHSLMRYPLSTGGNPRFGGLDELRQVAYEHGAPWFPGDFPGTDAGWNWEIEQRVKRNRDWDRRPKSKRVEWKSLDRGAGRKGEVGDGLSCDFEHLFGLPKGDDSSKSTAPVEAEAGPQRQNPASVEKGQDSSALASTMSVIPQITKAAFHTFLASSNLDKPPTHSIITVQLTFITRGVASSCARIYRLPTRPAGAVLPSTQTEVPVTMPPSVRGLLPDELRDQWLRQLPVKSAHANVISQRGKRLSHAPRMPPGAGIQTRKALLAKSLTETELPSTVERPCHGPATNQLDVDGYPLCPDEGDLIGFVTTGAFSMSKGKGTAIGSISAGKALETFRATGAREGTLCIVRNAGERVGWLARWEAV
ncbi:ribonucleases P/MRP protein subunit POP1-domain-containing protein [Apodospora peruviana]|uniref:Ribonucleases P/MRP protein subunit POP1-domain-containing protein n=1 Tax=Apodospora peruviana TaxID=516989 RepID=A0AAE0ISQ7_9PEZI|nr:ribonucleases P/MRP protein subunit POP1-domain-containing protein [Apodospora peruviana]